METVILNQIEDLYNQGSTKKEIEQYFGHGQNWSQKRFRELGLEGWNPNRYLITHKFFNPSLRQRSILVGTVMGDGYLRLGKRGKNAKGGNARLCLKHSPTQKDYLQWKVNQFGSLFNTKPKERTIFNKKVGKTYTGWSCKSRRHYWLTEWYYKFYPKGKKVVTQEILSYINDLALALWWMDDGGTPQASRGYPYLNLCLGNLTDLEYELIYNWFFSQGLNPVNIRPKSEHSVTIRFGAVGSKKLRKRISPYIPESMLYKFNRYLGVN